jgi:DNA-binding XRE family transcriptional regulator
VTPRLEATTIDGIWLVIFPTGAELTRTDRVPVIDFRAGTWASSSIPLTFEEHLASLPTLQDLFARFRRADPAFDREIEKARTRRYKDLLKEVRKGKMARLMAERLRCRLTQAELAERAGMKQPNISRLERANAVMSVATAKRLAEALGLTDYRVLLP